eukprot:TRINITY_DN64344_c0_g1_i1.p1 TRINITY_DN64344_c0_g1~~TRINITY_DN64344_c0_g1_i1.p1  ORF type:complete len:360 (+),score=50.82 TRINITY_DN64344_c0_g1_i1:161-1081(+)
MLEGFQVDAYWVRHGLSCANVLQMQTKRKFGSRWNNTKAMALGYSFTAYRDPPLTNCAIARAEITGPKILAKVHENHEDWVSRGLPILVFSSQMLRAVETALYNFEDSTVYPIPHIAEHGISADNIPSEWTEERALRYARDALSRVAFVEGVNDPFSGTLAGMKDKSSYTAFKQRFPLILQTILESKGVSLESLQGLGPIPVIIVSHSGFMKDELACEKDKPKKQKPMNNQAWKQAYGISLDGLQDGMCSENVLPVESYGTAPTLMCHSMIQRCREQFHPTYMLDADRDKCLAAGCSDGTCSLCTE